LHRIRQEKPVIKRAITFTRVSSDDRNKGGLNLSGQLELCRTFALNKGFTFGETILIIEHNHQGIIQ
jgi:DNA invertase Pin-like site-specific DNA recombinase